MTESARLDRANRSYWVEVLEDRLALSLAAGVGSALTHDQWRLERFDAVNTTAVERALVEPAQMPEAPKELLAEAGKLIHLDKVHQQYPYTGAGYSVAVIDTGIDYNNPYLGGGWGKRVIAGYDFVDHDTDPMDEEGHGTHVAGIIGSSHPVYTGVLPDVNLIALRVLDANGSGSYGDVEDALQWVIQHRYQYNIVAVNLSLGAGNYATSPYTFLEDEFQTLIGQGVFIAGAAGNDFYEDHSQQGLAYSAVSSNVVSVGAVWDGNYGSVAWSGGAHDYSTAPDRIVSFTQRSSRLDLLAPGTYITSTAIGAGFETLSGTSMATPFVAAAGAMIHQVDDAVGQSAAADQWDILGLLQSTGKVVIDGDDEDDNVVNTGLSFRRIDLQAAVQQVLTATAQADAANRTWVSALYQDVLGRSETSGGVDYWVSALRTGTTREQVATQFVTAPEKRNGQLEHLYTSLLHRDPDRAGLNYWLSAFAAGSTYRQVLTQIAQSDEYFAKSGGTAKGVITALYRDLLQRDPGTDGLNYWTAVLNQSGRSAVASGIAGSDEFGTQAIQGFYRAYLRRSADPAGLTYWTTLFHNGASFEQLAAKILASDEYFGSPGRPANAAVADAPGSLFSQGLSIGALDLAFSSGPSPADRIAADPLPATLAPAAPPPLSFARAAAARSGAGAMSAAAGMDGSARSRLYAAVDQVLETLAPLHGDDLV